MILEVAHAQAGHDLLIANASLTVYIGNLPPSVTTVTPPYVLVYTTVEFLAAGEDRARGIDGLASTCLTTWYCHCVGSTEVASIAVSGQVRASLLNVRPTVAGRICDRIAQVSASPINPDEALGTSVFDVLAIYELETRPTP